MQSLTGETGSVYGGGPRTQAETMERKRFIAIAASLFTLASLSAHGQQAALPAVNAPSQDALAIAIMRSGSQPSTKGPAENFTGSVRIDPLFRPKGPSHVSGSYVTFEPGARTAWHTHPLGQTLIVTAGTGRVQRWGDAVQEIRPGDVVWIPPGQKHWHGSGPTSAVTHIAIQEAVDGKNVDWMEPVTNEQYGK